MQQILHEIFCLTVKLFRQFENEDGEIQLLFNYSTTKPHQTDH